VCPPSHIPRSESYCFSWLGREIRGASRAEIVFVFEMMGDGEES
jgi:hypothetical protein